MALFQCLPVRKIEQQVSWNQMNEKTEPVMFVRITFKKSQRVNEPLFSWENCDAPCVLLEQTLLIAFASFSLILTCPDRLKTPPNRYFQYGSEISDWNCQQLHCKVIAVLRPLFVFFPKCDLSKMSPPFGSRNLTQSLYLKPSLSIDPTGPKRREGAITGWVAFPSILNPALCLLFTSC